MLYFFYGTDTDKARERAGALTAALQKKRPEAELFRLDAERWSEATLDELIGGQGLFSKNYLVILSHLFQNPDAEEVLPKKLSEIADSPNVFVMLEGRMEKKLLLAITEAAEKVVLHDKKEEKREKFNIFSLTDAFGRRDKRQLWVLFQQAVADGAVCEEIHGILFWQLKSMLLAHRCRSAEEAKVKPFVWSKAKAFAKQWSEDELAALSAQFVALYHDAHRGIHDFEVALERMILAL